MDDLPKQLWSLISGLIALGAAVGTGYVLYNNLLLLPPWLNIAGDLLYAIIAAILIFAAVFMVLYKGMHPY